jgi:hypothetical protein
MNSERHHFSTGSVVSAVLLEELRLDLIPQPILWGKVECRDCGRHTMHANEHDGRCRGCAEDEDAAAYQECAGAAVLRLYRDTAAKLRRAGHADEAVYFERRAGSEAA